MFVNQKSIKTLTQGIVTRQSEPHQSIDCFYSGRGPQRKSNQSIKRVNQRGRFRPELINQHKYINQVIINHVCSTFRMFFWLSQIFESLWFEFHINHVRWLCQTNNQSKLNTIPWQVRVLSTATPPEAGIARSQESETIMIPSIRDVSIILKEWLCINHKHHESINR